MFTGLDNKIVTGGSCGGLSSGTGGLSGGTNSLICPGTMPSFSTFPSSTLTLNNTIMQNKVAVFKVTRDEKEKITKTEFIKELWVETKNGQSVDFQVARDKDLAEYEMSELFIKTLLTVTF